MVGLALVVVALGGYMLVRGSHASAVVPSASTPCHTGIAPVAIKHVVVVMEENEGYGSVIGNTTSAPYINSLAGTCGLATNYHNTDHPSAPNYIELTSGQIAGGTSGKAYSNDCNYSGCPQSQNNIFNELDNAGMSWKDYAESMPSNCSIAGTTLYAMRHAPAAYYTNIHNTTCPKYDVPLSNSTNGGPTITAGALYNDVVNGTLPNLAFISPNLCDDGHSTVSGVCGSNKVANLDKWLKSWVPFILNGKNYASGDTEVMVLFDEGEGADKTNPEPCWNSAHSNTSSYPSCWTTAVFVGPNTPALQSSINFNHYNVLDALTTIFGLAPLTSTAYSTGYPTPASIISTFNFNAQPSTQTPTPTPSTVSTAIVSPANNATVSGTVTIKVATTGTITRSVVAWDGNVIRDATTQGAVGWGTQWNSTKAPNGLHTISDTVYDASGNTATASVTVNVNNPVASVTGP